MKTERDAVFEASVYFALSVSLIAVRSLTENPIPYARRRQQTCALGHYRLPVDFDIGLDCCRLVLTWEMDLGTTAFSTSRRGETVLSYQGEVTVPDQRPD